MTKVDVVIIGAGAAGLMCAITAGKRGRSVLVLEHNGRICEKVRISGGGRCNFTNINTTPSNYISANPHFCKSALSRYTPNNFIELIEKYNIAYHEKKSGQIFCNGSGEQIIHMLNNECRAANVNIQTGACVLRIDKQENYEIEISGTHLRSNTLVIATGGLSIPKSGATNYGHKIAKQFGINVVLARPGLVPLTISSKEFKNYRNLSGVSFKAQVTCNSATFNEDILFTHRGLSGPAILQASSYWHHGDSITINLLPGIDIFNILKDLHQSKKHLATILEKFLPLRFLHMWLEQHNYLKPMNQYSLLELRTISKALTSWQVIPTGTEGYIKAEVTVGGVDTNELSSKTMEVKKVPGLYFIGEVVDVTGWLGGYNLQWAWSSGSAAGNAL